jgi:predicted DNA-binding protein
MEVVKNHLGEEFKTSVLEKLTSDKIEFDVQRFSHLEYVVNSTERAERMIQCYDKRRTLASKNASKMSENEKNELDILILETEDKLAKLHKQLAEKKKYVQEFTETLLTQIEDFNKNAKETVEKAFTFYRDNFKSKKNEKVIALQQTFDGLEDKDLAGNWEERLVLFIALKRILKSDK